MSVLPIHDLTPFTLLDYPEKTACIIWFTGCNMRCAYCHNPDIVKGKGRYPLEHVIQFLQKRQGLLDGVVLSGGEATLYEDIIPFAETAKSMGYAIKLDTNGTRPERLKHLIAHKLVDFVALDYKAPLKIFPTVAGMNEFSAFSQSLDFLCAKKMVPFEVRTTVHTDMLNETDINTIITDLEKRHYKGTYYIQNYRPAAQGRTLGNMPPQSKILDKTKLNQPASFILEYRNF